MAAILNGVDSEQVLQIWKENYFLFFSFSFPLQPVMWDVSSSYVCTYVAQLSVLICIQFKNEETIPLSGKTHFYIWLLYITSLHLSKSFTENDLWVLLIQKIKC